MNEITIYHNPKCGTSRNTLAMIRNSGVEPKVIHYLETPPSRKELVALIAAMDIPAREILRKKGLPTTNWTWATPSGLTTSCSIS